MDSFPLIRIIIHKESTIQNAYQQKALTVQYGTTTVHANQLYSEYLIIKRVTQKY